MRNVKFSPTDEQIEAGFTAGIIRDVEEARALEPMVDYPTIVRLYNAVRIGINAGQPESRHWRHGFLLAMKIGWHLREQAGEMEGLARPDEEAEIEAMWREMQGGATA